MSDVRMSSKNSVCKQAILLLLHCFYAGHPDIPLPLHLFISKSFSSHKTIKAVSFHTDIILKNAFFSL